MPAPEYDRPKVVSHVPVPNFHPPRKMPVPNPPPPRRTPSQVPLPSYAQSASTQGTAGGKLMSLNSTIMAAQRDWEQKTRLGGKFGSSSHSESGDSAASDESDSDLEDVTAMSLPTQSQIATKRKLDSETAESSHQPQKRLLPPSSRRSSGLSASSSPASQSIAPALTQGPGRNSKTVWLTYTARDSIVSRADGTLYEHYHAGKDRFETMSGALCPTNYRLYKDSIFPYACPDKACRNSFETARAFGGHFSSKHKGTAYNDNCDGTFTKVGVYSKVPGEKWRAIVVSRVSSTGVDEEDAIVESEPDSFTEADVAMTSPDPFAYVTSFLPRHIDYSRFLSQAYIRELCELPKRRHLPGSWVQFHSGKDLSERMFALAVAYITGREVFGPDECDGGLHENGSRLSCYSIAIPFELSEVHKKVHFPDTSCVGCYYSSEVHGRHNRCSWATRTVPFLRRYENRIDGLESAEESGAGYFQSRATEVVAQQRRHARAVDAAIKAGKAASLNATLPSSRSQGSRPSLPDQESSSALPINDDLENAPLPPDENGFVYSHSFSRSNLSHPRLAAQLNESSQGPATGRVSRSATALRNSIQEQSASPAPPTQADQQNQPSSSQLQMEDWEVAPGRVIDSKHGENIAYSNAYLSRREPVPVSEDIAFNILTIKPGDNNRWEAHASQLRTCSVASGKVELRIGPNKVVGGPNTMFIIRPGESCVATNKLYGDATIHCTTVSNYSLLS
ncbi:hypothetical protein PWT90_06132 [Aphanocladium album]|nr:hypothetical protein PWT90_06132 [Aphanocladium album]